MKNTIQIVCVAVIVAVLSSAAMAVDIITVPVGNAGNTGEWSGESYGGYGPDRICGAVTDDYRIGKYEVTAGQYTEFLNKTAGVDAYGLYNSSMWSSSYGCKIERYNGVGTSGDPYLYRVDADWANRPVNYVSWGDAARFANWLHNGQGSGGTEDGTYELNGEMSDAALLVVDRESDWKWAITSEDEWYKAAYYDSSLNDGAGGYYDYPTSTNSVPSKNLVEPTDPGNNATFYDDSGHFMIDTYYRTEVGAHENSDSPYGTFDQGGNVWECNESIIGPYHSSRGGSFDDGYGLGHAGNLHASRRSHDLPTYEGRAVGFRVSEVPEPATMAILALGGIGILRRRKRVQR